jgi:hypothetical protein
VPAGRSRTALSDIGRDGARAPAEAGVVVRLSPDARRILARGDQSLGDASTSAGGGDVGDAPAATIGTGGAAGDPAAGTGRAAASDKASATSAGPKPLTPEDRQQVTRLAARDTAVRAHEAAHQAAARGLGGAASFSYETGPDGRRYAVGGEVPVSIRPGRTPQETIANAQVVRSAALAPADPSSQDMAVASAATQMEAQARQQITQSRAHGDDDGDPLTKKIGPAKDRNADSTGKVPGAPDDGAVPGAAKAADHDRDSLMVFSTLKAERGPMVNGHAHAAGGGCAICSRAAARYA